MWLVEISIRDKLQKQVWCDVVLMDVCHILLGRPQQYDKTIHDGYKNTFIHQGYEAYYSLTLEGVQGDRCSNEDVTSMPSYKRSALGVSISDALIPMMWGASHGMWIFVYIANVEGTLFPFLCMSMFL